MSSIRFVSVGWLQRISDGVAKILVKVLGHGEVHSEAGSDGNNGFVSGIDNCGSKSYVHNAVYVPQLGYQVNELNRRPVVSDLPSFGAHGKNLAGLNDHFVATHNHPLLTELNARSASAWKESRRVK